MIIGIITYILLALAIAFIGKARTLGFLLSFGISLLLTPIAGIISVMTSPKLILYHVVEHDCPECGSNYDKPHEACPYCMKQGKYVSLHSNVVAAT